MTIERATDILKIKLREFDIKWDGKWIPAGKMFWVAKLKIDRGGMMVATFNPLTGITIFDSIMQYKESSWKDLS